MKMKKAVALLLSSAMIGLALLSGCTKTDSSNATSSSKDGKIQLSFWTLSTRQGAVDPIVEKFQEQNKDIEIKVSYYDTDGIKDACKVAASSNTLPSMWFNWGGSLAGFYAENNLVYDLTEYAKENDWSNKFNSGALSLCTLSGQLAGYPTSYNVLDVYYKKDIFEKNNIAIPTTFEEFEAACATLKEQGITPISTAGLNGWHVMRFIELLIEHYAGPELHDKLNTFEESWTNEAVVKALEKYQEFCQKGYFPDGFVTADPNDTKMAMVSGTAAMDIQGQWYDGQIIQDGVDINLFDTFAFPSGQTNRLSAFAEMVQLNKNLSADEVAATMKFLDYYYTEENANQYAEFYNLPLPTVNATMPEGQPNVKKMIETSSQNGTFTITDQALPTEVADVLFAQQDALANMQTTPAEAAQTIQDAIEAYQNK